jgi:hypothetical protein
MLEDAGWAAVAALAKAGAAVGVSGLAPAVFASARPAVIRSRTGKEFLALRKSVRNAER